MTDCITPMLGSEQRTRVDALLLLNDQTSPTFVSASFKVVLPSASPAHLSIINMMLKCEHCKQWRQSKVTQVCRPWSFKQSWRND
jgi:hypothetical protein